MARAAEEARSAAQASNAAAESSLASCEVFEADASFAAQRLECPITTEAMKEGDRVMKLPCGHMFLEESIRMWLGTSNTCPLCRAELPTRSGAARVDPERAAYDAARRVAQDHGGAPGGGAAGHGGAGSSYHSTGLRVAALPRGGGYGPGVTQRSSAQYPMARGAPQGGGWRPAPSYPPRHDGEGCCVM
ncbi:hypothetical protein FNF27_05473 [Cafeteria roenbergensis]|uniref:RING-type domain-containing protein n=1 Tax=Cafeteria roenbergensis TaxID=33653 RepID=A0A5A8E5C7_CAFRO|nr:hypothetical protein FNF29_08132 [Cafeteria roenbergensis]KAA0166195.1 hypothetical protein FNF31_01421 [Cafeteria roenbergensis]KAA0169598.1 hypothetical protein FNF28_02042 [Cafeteria roenbergensis]KAA0172982.1 hypothetical protein FNF27_05473 [Cafeteria roenbergensis]|eukprot:KAA0146317.1 hypothetical protein FNF29_08132 [Cafeteria roenbergensis]